MTIHMGHNIDEIASNGSCSMRRSSFQSYPVSPASAISLCSTSPCFSTKERIGGRFHGMSRKFAFWRKGQSSAADVHSSLQTLAKSHEKYRKDTVAAFKDLANWLEYMEGGRNIEEESDEKQNHNLRNYTNTLLYSMKPMVEAERNHAEQISLMIHTFEMLKRDEADWKQALKKQQYADRRFYKASAKDERSLEAQRYCEERFCLMGELSFSAERFRKSYNRVLPMLFQNLAHYYEFLSKEAGTASINMFQAQRNEKTLQDGTSMYKLFPTSSCASPIYSEKPHCRGLSMVRIDKPTQPAQDAITPEPDNNNNNNVTSRFESTENPCLPHVEISDIDNNYPTNW